MSPVIRASCSPGEIRIALCRDDAVEDYAIWRPGAPDGVGDLHRAQVAALVPSMAGAFLMLSDGSEAFLPDSAKASGPNTESVSEGDAVRVRITRAPQGGKGARATARLTEAESAALGDAPFRRGPGPLLELAAAHPDATVLTDSPGVAATLAPALQRRLERVPKAFDAALEAEIAALAEPETNLSGGLRAHIAPTPALVAIDLDTGAATSEGGPRSQALFQANRAALPELARHIRLRNLSGAILIDFAGLPPKRRAGLGPALTQALAADPLRPRLLGFTALGLAEIVRPRIRPPLHEMLSGPHAAGLAALRKVALESAARPSWHPTLRAAPAIVTALRADDDALQDLAYRAGRSLILRADPALPPLRWILEE